MCCDRSELSSVLANLCDERIIEKSPSDQVKGYKLIIPLVSEALKKHADQLIEEALIKLGIDDRV
jgi:hypothetical protein